MAPTRRIMAFFQTGSEKIAENGAKTDRILGDRDGMSVS
jgi:hypothetical protein